MFAAACAGAVLMVGYATAQQTLTAADYARAESRLNYRTSPLVDHSVTTVNWLDDDKGGADRFWYRDRANGNSTFMLMDAAHGTKATAFDHAKMAAALNKAGVRNATATNLPIAELSFPDATSWMVTSGGDRYLCTTHSAAYDCAKQPQPKQGNQPAGEAITSPDGEREVFIRNWNLWVRDIATGAEKQLTTDGVQDYGYATDNAGWTHSDRAIVEWSPDSKKVATFQQDQRKTGMMYLVSTNVGHPTLDAWRYPFAGDKDVTMIERVIIDVDAAKVTRLKMPPDEHRSSLCDDVSCSGGWDDVQWSADAKTLAFLSTARNHKREDLRIADVATGDVRDVMHEESKTYFESGYSDSSYGKVNWRYLSKRNEILWFSERSNYGHLYVYDAANGKLKRQVTGGDWNVAEVMRVDEATGDIFFRGAGREKGWDPYYAALYRTNLDGKEINNGLRLLTPEQSYHKIDMSDDGKYFVDIYSTPQTPPVTVLRDADGKRLQEIATADISRLKATGWQVPENIVVKARDGKTDLYGVMFKPSNFDPAKKYPIIDYVYPNPLGSVGGRNFTVSRSGESAGLAELGFIVIAIDGMGTEVRSKKFLDEYYGDMGDNTLPDQVTALKQLAAKYQWIDLNRAGIWGHSGGGFATARAMFRYPDFFKVGWSESGNHDNRNYEDDWAEEWIGLEDAANKAAYESQANESLAKNLKGKLMLVHGTADDNVPPQNTLLVVNELMKAGKDFDLLMIPNARHGYGDRSYYIMRRRWDYFVTNLMGATPPKEYPLGAAR